MMGIGQSLLHFIEKLARPRQPWRRSVRGCFLGVLLATPNCGCFIRLATIVSPAMQRGVQNTMRRAIRGASQGATKIDARRVAGQQDSPTAIRTKPRNVGLKPIDTELAARGLVPTFGVQSKFFPTIARKLAAQERASQIHRREGVEVRGSMRHKPEDTGGLVARPVPPVGRGRIQLHSKLADALGVVQDRGRGRWKLAIVLPLEMMIENCSRLAAVAPASAADVDDQLIPEQFGMGLTWAGRRPQSIARGGKPSPKTDVAVFEH
jgi:hypothetical protein